MHIHYRLNSPLNYALQFAFGLILSVLIQREKKEKAPGVELLVLSHPHSSHFVRMINCR